VAFFLLFRQVTGGGYVRSLPPQAGRESASGGDIATENKIMNLFGKLRQMRILLIDDDEWIRDSLSMFFEAEGCRLLALETAEIAMERLNRDRYDIIIADYRLPGMDGLEFFRRIRNIQPDCIKILITAYGSEDVRVEAAHSGIQDMIAKPFTSRVLENALARLLLGKP
jgi:DNA-binding response OmpR family regulator